jgi:predicted amidohydrolase
MPRIALFQMTASTDVDANIAALQGAVREARDGGATMLFTPEMSGMLDRDRTRASANIRQEEDDRVLSAMRDAAADAGIWIALGSLAVDLGDGRWANRSFVIDDNGNIAARYDKIHMFDVTLSNGESWRESNAYAPGDGLGIVENTPVGRLGLSVCYDIRFPALFEALGRAKCDCIAIPAAFTVPTGKAHWHVLQRARAIEASAFVMAAAQVGDHADGRSTYGHSLAIDPWGEVLLDMGGETSAIGFAQVDLARVKAVRDQVPSLDNKRPIRAAAGQGPQ